MSDLAKTVQNFLTRDIIYIVGGTSVIASALFACDSLQAAVEILGRRYEWPVSVFLILLFVGLAYAIAYGVQELLSYAPGTPSRTALYWQDRPSKAVKSLYKRYMHEEYDFPCDKNPRPENLGHEDDAWVLIDEKASKRSLADLERRIRVLQLSTTLGSCLLVSGVVLGIRIFMERPLLGPLTLCALLLGISLLLHGKVKLAQMTQFAASLVKRLEAANDKPAT